MTKGLTRRSEALQWGSSWSRPAFAGAWQVRIEGETADRVLQGARRPLGAERAPTADTSCEGSRPCDPCCCRCWASPRMAAVIARCRCTAPRLAVLLGTWSERNISFLPETIYLFRITIIGPCSSTRSAAISLSPSSSEETEKLTSRMLTITRISLGDIAERPRVTETKRYGTMVVAVATCPRKNTTAVDAEVQPRRKTPEERRHCDALQATRANFCSPSFRPP